MHNNGAVFLWFFAKLITEINASKYEELLDMLGSTWKCLKKLAEIEGKKMYESTCGKDYGYFSIQFKKIIDKPSDLNQTGIVLENGIKFIGYKRKADLKICRISIVAYVSNLFVFIRILYAEKPYEISF